MLSKFRLTSQKGFTLIELLIVVAIIGILAAIAIPQFGAYRKRGYNAAANSDLRSIRTTEEAMMADFAEYGASRLASDATASAAQEATATVFLIGAMTSTTNQSISLSPRVYAAVKAGQVAGTPNARYNAVTSHSQGDQYYGADSDGTSLYRQGFSTWAAGATLTATPAVDTGTAEFATPWVTMQ